MISGSSAFSKTSLNICKLTVHVLLKPGLDNSKHYLGGTNWAELGKKRHSVLHTFAQVVSSWRMIICSQIYKTKGCGFGDPEENLTALGFPGGSASIRISLQCGRCGFSPWVGKVPWRRERLPTPGFLSGEFHGLYSPWGCKELDTNEQLPFSLLCLGLAIISSLSVQAVSNLRLSTTDFITFILLTVPDKVPGTTYIS